MVDSVGSKAPDGMRIRASVFCFSQDVANRYRMKKAQLEREAAGPTSVLPPPMSVGMAAGIL